VSAPRHVATASVDLDRVERDLAGVEAALPRLDDGTYWTDEVTGQPLDDAQLAKKRHLAAKLVLERGMGDKDLRVLDIGCGAGAFLRTVVRRGGVAHGLDASDALVAFARTRLPTADLRVGEMEALPWEDDTFDLVTGFNSFFFANDMVVALREARRVAKPGSPVVIQAWGAHERCDLEAMKELARPFLPPRPPDAPPDPDLSAPGALSAIAGEAGLTPESEFDTTWAYEYPDAETLGRAMIAVAGLAVLAGPDREHELETAIVEGLAPFRRPDGSYRFSNEYRFLIAST